MRIFSRAQIHSAFVAFCEVMQCERKQTKTTTILSLKRNGVQQQCLFKRNKNHIRPQIELMRRQRLILRAARIDIAVCEVKEKSRKLDNSGKVACSRLQPINQTPKPFLVIKSTFCDDKNWFLILATIYCFFHS